jgi:hypothetical protein
LGYAALAMGEDADEERILAVALSADAEREPFSVIVNWQAGLKR